jgi:hypothetical protein
MPALMAAAACSDESEGECGDGWFSGVAVMLSDVCLRVGDGGSEFRSGGIVACFVQLIKSLTACWCQWPCCAPLPRLSRCQDKITPPISVHASCD